MLSITAVYVVLGVTSCLAALHPSSPCSNVFSYEGSQPENERWYGVALLSTDESLVGVRIDVKLDRPAEILVSWMGTVTTNDNVLFTILNLDQKLHPGPPLASRFMVKFNSLKGSPQVRTIRLNGKQICPPDPNFSVDSHHNSQDHINENQYTTERQTRRPDLDLDDDWTNARPNSQGTGGSHKPPLRDRPSGHSGTGTQGSSGGYSTSYLPSSSSVGSGYSGFNQNSGSSGLGNGNGDGYSHGQNSGSSGSSSGSGYSHGQPSGGSSLGLSSSSGGSYSHTANSGDSLGTSDSNGYSGGSYNSNVNKPSRTPSENYDSHETYHANHRPSGSSSDTMSYSNSSRPSSGHQSSQDSYRPLVMTDYNSPARPSISININKDVTYNVDRPDALSNGESSNSFVPDRPNREPSYSNNNHQKPTEKYDQNNNYHQKTTTKKPVVINSININIHNSDPDNTDNLPSQTKTTTTRRPAANNNKNTNNNNRATTRRPTTAPGNQSNRPNRNPEIVSETHYQPGYNQNSYGDNERTTERNYHNYNNQGSGSKEQTNQRPPGVDFIENSRPNPIPSSRPSGGSGNKKIPRPLNNSGEAGDVSVNNANIKCGSVEVNPAPLITHGQNTARGQWPWHIALYRIEGINLSYSCGGSLISSTVVMTAAHCVTKAPRDRPVDADILVVQLGKYHLYQFSDDSVQNKQVQSLHVHPRYNSTNYLDDLAILILSSPAEFTKFVRPVCLWPKNNFNLPNIDNKEGTVVGWGYDENNQVTEELKMARMPVVSYITCIKSYPQFFSQFTAENKTYCAGFRQGTSVCNGDSGGGMVFQQSNQWYLRGLVSITVAKQGLRVCDTKHYVVFTDVANYIDWINQYV